MYFFSYFTEGPLKIRKNLIKLDVLEKELEPLDLELGGSHRPKSCIALFRVAIIVPYRNREDHLNLFLYNLHPMLVRQQLDYTIFIVEQECEFFRYALLFSLVSEVIGYDKSQTSYSK